jgi:hypothetical protein
MRSSLCILLTITLLIGAGVAYASTPRLVLPAVPDGPVVVDGLSADELYDLQLLDAAALEEVFAIFVDTGGDVPAMLGSYAFDDGRLVFTPRYPLVPGQRYRAEFVYGYVHLDEPFTLDAAAAVPETRVASVYPSTDVVPENLLKFYVYFTNPMRGGDVYTHVHLVDAAGNQVAQGFVETVPELWDPSMTRVTVICHPGRIKQGLNMRESLGPALVQGGEYRLVVDAGIEDASGTPMAEGFEKSFTVGEADRTSPVPAAWAITPPDPGTDAPLRVSFREPLEHALLERMVTVRRKDGTPVPGEVRVSSSETVWEYVPHASWKAGDYLLVAYVNLEDLAGNQIDRPFDVRPGDTPVPDVATEVRIPFSVTRQRADKP